MHFKGKLSKIQLLRLKILINNFIEGKEPSIVIRSRMSETRHKHCHNALIKNTMTNGIGGSWIEL